jgi:hypothetical protein
MLNVPPAPIEIGAQAEARPTCFNTVVLTTLAGAIVLLTVVALLASYRPARCASTLEPMQVCESRSKLACSGQCLAASCTLPAASFFHCFALSTSSKKAIAR